ncbi:methyl-accepting chemotaxis protein [Arcobacter sp. LA11]|uniref:methyl-accepting chemotaxis protein n=1 Tax=Arcobacter sp. LA11 TaxID=1898176 RepID=UPI0009331454|nr:cache domain-containing protein [Arcobacter sp. LA11]
MIKKGSIKNKLMAIFTIAIVIISVGFITESISSLNAISKSFIDRTSVFAYKTKEKEVKNYVSLAYKTMENYYSRTSKEKIQKEVENYLQEQTEYLFSILNSEYEANKDLLTKEELQNRLKSIIRASKFGKAGYFFGYDNKGTSVVHGSNQSYEGKNLIHIKDKNGVYIVKNIVKAGTSSKGEGFVTYHWEKPGYKELQLKVTFVKTFKPYGWILVTGSYVNDVSEKIKQEALAAISKMGYGQNGYFWVNDSKHIVKAHGKDPSIVGKNMIDFKDKKGIYIYREIVNIANKNKEGGILNYHWSKLNEKGVHKKISYVKKFEPWDLIIGTGVYADDIEQEVLIMEEETSKDVSSKIVTFIIMLVLMLIVILFIILIVMNKIIFKPLNRFQDGLLNFFKYVNKEQDDIDLLKVESNDEIGNMTSLINDNISKTKAITDQDDTLIDNVKEIVNHVGNGFLDKRITSSTNNESLEELKSLLNTMLDNLNGLVGNNINALSDVLEKYANRDFTYKIDKSNSGKIGVDIVNMNRMITKILQDNQKDGLSLQTRSNELTTNVQILNENANSQAVSLEETAASIEEITSNIRQTSEKAQVMLDISTQTQKSSSMGKDLATKTATSMDEINETVVNINEAITVIDQIAFQTNILSLNAAVEAATAGESGKGFAVVAQEVRNLASRSAEAAKEIKALVEMATVRANEGKEVSSAMIEGFNELENNISETSNLIDDVSNAAKEQSTGISQISDAVNQLDKFTQQNAAVADKTNSIAMETNNIAIDIVDNVNKNKFDN